MVSCFVAQYWRFLLRLPHSVVTQPLLHGIMLCGPVLEVSVKITSQCSHIAIVTWYHTVLCGPVLEVSVKITSQCSHIAIVTWYHALWSSTGGFC